MIFPEPVTRKVFFAPLWVFIFGIFFSLLPTSLR